MRERVVRAQAGRVRLFARCSLARAALVGTLAACGTEQAGNSGRDGPPAGYVQQPLEGHALTLPRGFSIAVYAEDLPGVRLMALGPDGGVYATLTEAGRVVRVGDPDGNGTADRVVTVADGLELPHGLAFRGDTLYVAESHRVVRFDRPGASPTIVVANLPADGGPFSGSPIAVRQGPLLATSFHPELTHDDRFHAYFVELVRQQGRRSSAK